MNEAQLILESFNESKNGGGLPVGAGDILVYDVEIDTEQNVVWLWTSTRADNEATFCVVNPPIGDIRGVGPLEALARLIAGAVK